MMTTADGGGSGSGLCSKDPLVRPSVRPVRPVVLPSCRRRVVAVVAVTVVAVVAVVVAVIVAVVLGRSRLGRRSLWRRNVRVVVGVGLVERLLGRRGGTSYKQGRHVWIDAGEGRREPQAHEESEDC